MAASTRALAALTLAAAMSGVVAVSARAQTSPEAPAPPTGAPATVNPPPVQVDDQAAPGKPEPLPVDVDRIERQVKRQSAIRLDDEQLRFYVLVLAKAPPFKLEDWVTGYDLQQGPTKGGAAMTHREFVNMVTPRELKELFGATSGSSFAMFQAAVMNALGQTLISKAVRDLRAARNDQEVQAIRERIDRELTALLERDRR